MKFIELNHTLVNGLVTYPGDPPVVIDYYHDWDEMVELCGEGAAAILDRIQMINTSGTYVDAPVHRRHGDKYVCDIPLEKLVDLPFRTVVLPQGKKCFEVEDVMDAAIPGGAVLLCTGHSEKFGTDAYGKDAPYLSEEAAQYLMEQGVVLVGIDTPLIDRLESDQRPVHDIILKAGNVICEDMTNLKATVGLKDALLTAVPPKVRLASCTARVFVKVRD